MAIWCISSALYRLGIGGRGSGEFGRAGCLIGCGDWGKGEFRRAGSLVVYLFCSKFGVVI